METFWEDRYHATAISTDQHLIQCMHYIDLNMIRAGIIKHPKEWKTCGYQDINHPAARKTISDLQILVQLFNLNTVDELKTQYNQWLENRRYDGFLAHDDKWSQSIAVGSKSFIDEVSGKLGKKVKYREMVGKDDSYILREPNSDYNTHFNIKKGHLRLNNTYFLDLST